MLTYILLILTLLLPEVCFLMVIFPGNRMQHHPDMGVRMGMKSSADFLSHTFGLRPVIHQKTLDGTRPGWLGLLQVPQDP
jgi:hypothetical protein